MKQKTDLLAELKGDKVLTSTVNEIDLDEESIYTLESVEAEIEEISERPIDQESDSSNEEVKVPEKKSRLKRYESPQLRKRKVNINSKNSSLSPGKIIKIQTAERREEGASESDGDGPTKE